MKSVNFKNFTSVFGLVAIIAGLVIEVVALVIQFDSLSSAEGVVAGATLLAIGVAFLQSKSLLTGLTLIAISALGFGYFVLIQTQNNWGLAALATILVGMFLIYFLEIRSKIRTNHSNWYK